MSHSIVEIPLSWSKGVQRIKVADDNSMFRAVGVRLNPDAEEKGFYNVQHNPYIAVEMDDDIDLEDFVEAHVWIIQNGSPIPDEEDDSNDMEFVGSFLYQGELYHVYALIITPE